MRDQDFLNHFLEKGYFKDYSRVVLALSGGLDSMFQPIKKNSGLNYF